MQGDPDSTDRTGEEPMNTDMRAEELEATRERQRLLALLALTSQELPRKQRDSRELHDYLDANVEAFEALITKHRAARTAQGATKARFPVWRLAASIAAVGVLTAIVLTMLSNREGTLQAALDRGYAQLAERNAIPPTVEANSQGAPAQLGFSSAQRATAASKSFAAGVAEGEARLARSAASERDKEDSFYILGQWNALLAAAVRSEQPVSFWLAQRELGQRLVKELSAASEVDEQAVAHLQKLDAMLAVLADKAASGGRSGRTEYELAKELQLFRSHLAPGGDSTR
jgi:hypothetical protein